MNFLGSIPMDPKISEDSDMGRPFILEHPDSPASDSFMKIIQQIREQVEKGKS